MENEYNQLKNNGFSTFVQTSKCVSEEKMEGDVLFASIHGI